jgi:hypothetical protein
LAASLGAAGAEPASLCRGDEAILFSCNVGRDLVSLCATRTAGRISALAYRDGPPGHIETEYVASPGNGNRFLGTVSPAAPGASVKQVWFNRGNAKYLLTECVGGNCPQAAGLTVFRDRRIVRNERCARTADDRAWFSKDLVQFGSDIAKSHSASDLLQLEDFDNDIDQIYRVRRAPQ